MITYLLKRAIISWIKNFSEIYKRIKIISLVGLFGSPLLHFIGLPSHYIFALIITFYLSYIINNLASSYKLFTFKNDPEIIDEYLESQNTKPSGIIRLGVLSKDNKLLYCEVAVPITSTAIKSLESPNCPLNKHILNK